MIRCTSLLCLLVTAGAMADEPLFPNSNFETGTLQGWTAKGDAVGGAATVKQLTIRRLNSVW